MQCYTVAPNRKGAACSRAHNGMVCDAGRAAAGPASPAAISASLAPRDAECTAAGRTSPPPRPVTLAPAPPWIGSPSACCSPSGFPPRQSSARCPSATASPSSPARSLTAAQSAKAGASNAFPASRRFPTEAQPGLKHIGTSTRGSGLDWRGRERSARMSAPARPRLCGARPEIPAAVSLVPPYKWAGGPGAPVGDAFGSFRTFACGSLLQGRSM